MSDKEYNHPRKVNDGQTDRRSRRLAKIPASPRSLPAKRRRPDSDNNEKEEISTLCLRDFQEPPALPAREVALERQDTVPYPSSNDRQEIIHPTMESLEHLAQAHSPIESGERSSQIIFNPPGQSPLLNSGRASPGHSPQAHPSLAPPGQSPQVHSIRAPPGQSPQTYPTLAPPGQSPQVRPILAPPGQSPQVRPILAPPGRSPQAHSMALPPAYSQVYPMSGYPGNVYHDPSLGGYYLPNSSITREQPAPEMSNVYSNMACTNPKGQPNSVCADGNVSTEFNVNYLQPPPGVYLTQPGQSIPTAGFIPVGQNQFQGPPATWYDQPVRPVKNPFHTIGPTVLPKDNTCGYNGTVSAGNWGLPGYCDPVRSSAYRQPPDLMSPSEMEAIDKKVSHLSSTWRQRGGKVFTGFNGEISLAAHLQQWYEFCSSQWVHEFEPTAVRTFLMETLSPSLSLNVRGLNCGPVCMNSRDYYRRLFLTSVQFLRLNHNQASHTTNVIQKLLTAQQGSLALNEHLDQLTSLLQELRHSGSSDIHTTHVSQAVQGSLVSPYNAWYFEEARRREPSGNVHTFDEIFAIFDHLRHKVNALEGHLPMPTNPMYYTSPSQEGVKLQPASSDANIKEETNAKEASNTKKKQISCRRCLAPDHMTRDCKADRPRNLEQRCRCGSIKHGNDSCPIPMRDIRCDRCLDDQSVPKHRSGVCPIKFSDLKANNKKSEDGPSTTTESTNYISSGTCYVTLDGGLSLPMENDLIDIHNDTQGCYYIDGIDVGTTTTSTLVVTDHCLTLNPSQSSNHLDGADDYCEAGSQPVSTGLCISPTDQIIQAILDSGSGRNYGRLNFIKRLEAIDGVQLRWSKSDAKIAAHGANGGRLEVHCIAYLCCWPPLRPHGKAWLKIHCVQDLSPDLLIGVSGLRALRISMRFGPAGISATSGTADTQYVERIEEAPAKKLFDNTNFIADEICLFDEANYLTTLATNATELETTSFTELDDDYTYDLQKVSLSETVRGLKLSTDGFSLQEALRHNNCTLRGLKKEISEDGCVVYRFLHDFVWYPHRPQPSSANLREAKARAASLKRSLKAKGFDHDYEQVFQEYLQQGHIEEVSEEEVVHCYYTPHFPVYKNPQSGDELSTHRKTRVRPVYDWRATNSLQLQAPITDKRLWPSLLITRCYQHVIWSDLKQAYLFCRMPKDTQNVHGFVVAYDKKAPEFDSDYLFRFFRFTGLPMGPSSSPSAMQVSAGLMVTYSNGKTQQRLSGSGCKETDKKNQVLCPLEELLANAEEEKGLTIQRPSQAALRCANSLEASKQQLLYRPATDTIIVDAINERRCHSMVMYKNGMDRTKFMDDWILGANTEDEVTAMYMEDLETTHTFGHVMHPSKTKRSTDKSCVEGLGLVWDGTTDSIKAKYVDLERLQLLVSDHGQITIRETLSYLHKAHDVFGIHGWVLYGIKIILRESFVSNKQMDDKISVENTRRVYELLVTYNSNITTVCIPRYIKTDNYLTTYTDASNYGLAACIYTSNVQQPLLCSSRLVPLHQARFSIVRKEQLALEHGLQLIASILPDLPYSEDRNVNICIDSLIVVQRVHRALKLLSSSETAKPTIPKSWSRWEYLHSLSAARWVRSIAAALGEDPSASNFSKVKLIHCPSSKNLADPYTRGYNPQELDQLAAQAWLSSILEGDNKTDADSPHTHDSAVSSDSIFSVSEATADIGPLELAADVYDIIVSKQQEDPFCCYIRYLKGFIDKKPSTFDDDVIDRSDQAKLKALYGIHNEQGKHVIRLLIGRDLKQEDKSLLYVPQEARELVLAKFHLYACHRNDKHQYAQMASFYYWKGMRRDIKKFCRLCPACQQARGHAATIDEEVFLNSKVHLDLNTVLSVDWIGPVHDQIEAGNDVKYCLHIYDPFRRFSTFYPSRERGSADSVRIFSSHCWHHGWPFYCQSDGDKSFTGKVFTSFCKSMGVKQLIDPPHAPQRRAFLERSHQAVFDAIRSFRCSGCTTPWYQLLPLITHSLNSTQTGDVGEVSPNDLTFTYPVRPPPTLSGLQPPDNALQFVQGHCGPPSYDGVISQRQSEFEHLVESYRDYLKRIVRSHSIKVAERSKRRRGCGITPGTVVWLKKMAGTKLAPRWVGPVRIKREQSCASRHLVDIESLHGVPLGTVHSTLIKPANLSKEQLEEYSKMVYGKSSHPAAMSSEPAATKVPGSVSKHIRYFNGVDSKGLTTLQRSIVLPNSSTGLWVQCDKCSIWTEVSQELYDYYGREDRSFICDKINCRCIQ